MHDSLDKFVDNARAGTGPCVGCPATVEKRVDGHPRSEGVNPGLGIYDAAVVFVTIEPSPAHGKAIDWEEYDWAEYNERYYYRLLDHWDSGDAVRSIIGPVEGVTTSDVWIADSLKCPPRTGEDDQRREVEFEHCRTYLARELAEIDPEVVVALGNRSASRTLSVLGGPDVQMGTATHAGHRFETDPPLIVSPSWPHGWLFDRSPAQYWGGDWVASQPELRAGEWDSYLEIVQTALDACLNG